MHKIKQDILFYSLVCVEFGMTGGVYIHEEINVGSINEAHDFVSANAGKYPDAFWILRPCHMIR